MRHKHSIILITILSLIIGLGLGPNPQGFPQPTVRVLLFGDSWAGLMWQHQTYQQVFDGFGYSDMRIDGSLTKTGGSANSWSQAQALKLVLDKLQDTPSIDIVVISLGGNDLLGTWHAGMGQEEEEELLKGVQIDLIEIVKLILEIRPEIEILLTGYDYTNFVDSISIDDTGRVRRVWEELGNPDPAALNFLAARLEQQKAEIANADERVYYVQALGLMQYVFGYQNPPDYFDAGFAPNTVAFPGQEPPGYDPFPGGDINYPSPPEAMALNGADPIHLSAAGYRALATIQMLNYFLPKFRGTPAVSIPAQDSGESGWVRADGMLGVEHVIMGDEGADNAYRGILSFDTSDIHNRAEITRATISLTRITERSGSNPFMTDRLGQARVDIVAGSFNLPEIEPSDYASNAHVESGGTFFGDVREVGNTLRIELDEAGIAAIDKRGLTQVRIYFPETDEDADWIGFENGALEVYYAPPPFSLLDLFDPDVQLAGVPVAAILLIVCIGGLAFGAIAFTGIMMVRRRQASGPAR